MPSSHASTLTRIKRPAATLYLFAGLPGSGKSTLAQLLVQHLGAAYVRIDTIEHALREVCALQVQGEGYRLAYRLAADNLRLGMSVVADSCNPIALTRCEWEQVAVDAGVPYVHIEVICSDEAEHRQRVETRPPTVAGLELPTWRDVQNRTYHAWTVERIVIDTANQTVDECMQELLKQLAVHVSAGQASTKGGRASAKL